MTVTATTSVGTVQKAAAVQVVTPVLGATSVSPTSFYGGAGASGSTTVTYTITSSADVAVIAEDASGTKVATVQASTSLAAGTYSIGWSGVGGSGSSLPAGTYALVVRATTSAGAEESSQSVTYTPTPVANEAALALNATGGYVLHTVVEQWDESLNGQTSANLYFDGKAQPWEFAAFGGATVTLYVGANPASQDDTTAGGSVTGSRSRRTGVTDLTFPSITWYDSAGSSLPRYYSIKVSYGGSSRWYPAVGRFQLHAPVGADGSCSSPSCRTSRRPPTKTRRRMRRRAASRAPRVRTRRFPG